MPAIEFKNQVCGRTEEIYDVGTNRCLAPEVRAEHGWFFQGLPQDPLVRGGILRNTRRPSPSRGG